MQNHDVLGRQMTRRLLLGAAGMGGLALLPAPARAEETVDLRVPGGPSTRPITTAYPQKGRMILQRTSPPWLETPFEVFDKGVFTPNDQHYVSWHWADFPSAIDVDKFHLTVRGLVNQTLTLSIKDILHGLPRVEIAAVSQCAGNSRIFMQPRVAGAQWANGSMSNTLWTGVRLKDVLDRAGVKARAVQVRLCVQRRLACSAGERPAGARVRSPVVWIAGWRETKTLKPIDNVSLGKTTSHRAVTTVNAKVASKVRSPEGRVLNRRAKAAWGSRNLTDAAPSLRRGGSDSTVARTCRATGEALLVPARNRRSRVDRITGSTGKSIEGERVTDGFAVAVRRGNARGAKEPCCL